MMCSGNGGRAGRMAMRMSYRDTRKGFRVGSRKRKHSTSSARVHLSSKAAHQALLINQLHGAAGLHPRHPLPRIVRHHRHGKLCFAQDFMAPLMMVFLGIAALVVAASVLPVNGPGLVLLVMLGAIALIVGIKVANSSPGR